MLVRIGPRPLFVGSGAWLALAGCPQLLTDEFRDVGISTAIPDAGGRQTGGTGTAPHPGSDAGSLLGAGGRGAEGGVAGARQLIDEPDASSASPVDTLRAGLAHRYALDGTGSNAADSVGDADGYVWNTELDDRGVLSLNGDDEYLSLPNGLLSSNNDKTIELWVTWRGGDRWQRLFDFGSSDAGELNQGVGVSYLFLTAASGEDLPRVAYTADGYSNEIHLDGTLALPVGTPTHVAVVVDSARDALSLYLDGALNATTTLAERLADIQDVNLWVGRSQFATDPSLDGDVSEFRIYDRALDTDQVALSYRLGPDGLLE